MIVPNHSLIDIMKDKKFGKNSNFGKAMLIISSVIIVFGIIALGYIQF